MPAGPLVQAADLAGFPGAPFSDQVVLAAGEMIRAEADWHIAPQVTETLTVRSAGGMDLFLPTRHLTAVTAVRQLVASGPAQPVTGWDPFHTALFTAGVLHYANRWPYGVLEVDVEHGYESCPPDLLPLVAALCRDLRSAAASGSVRLGSLSISSSEEPDSQDLRRLPARYRVISL